MRFLNERAEVLKMRLNPAAMDVHRLVTVRKYLEEVHPTMLPDYYHAISIKLPKNAEEANILLAELAIIPEQYLTPNILHMMQLHIDMTNEKRQAPN